MASFGSEIFDYLAEQCKKEDPNESSHWKHFHRNFKFSNGSFKGLEGFGNSGERNDAFSKLAHHFLQIPFRKMGKKYSNFAYYNAVAKQICSTQGRAYTLDFLRQAITLSFLDKYLPKSFSNDFYTCVIGDGFGSLTSLILESSFRKRVILINLSKTLLVDLWYVKHLKGEKWFDENVTLITSKLDIIDEKKLIAVEASNSSLIADLPINLFINIVSMQEMTRTSIKDYFAHMRSAADRRQVFFYCCNRVEKNLPDGTVIRFLDYPWSAKDLIISDELCPWHQTFYTGRLFPIYRKYDGPIKHRLSWLN